MVVQYVYQSWQMKEPLLGISISFYLEKMDKLFMLQHHFRGIDKYPVDSLDSTIHI